MPVFEITVKWKRANVQVRLDGFGNRWALVSLEAGATYDLTWFWDVAELAEVLNPFVCDI